jgi:ubiquinone/menaquinone biosynthesis C-methylase UbiE
VRDAYVKICASRFAENPNIRAVLYNGDKLPLEDNTFSSVLSGHIIEHTRNPKFYLHEHIRVMQERAYMFLEFPTRYHVRELHTGLPSLEWLPKPLRYMALSAILSKRSPFSEGTRKSYRAVLETLEPVSRWQIQWWLRQMPWRSTIENWTMPAPGVVRMIVRKLG